jgi:hypothetical protein
MTSPTKQCDRDGREARPHPVWGHLRDPWTGKPVDSLSDLLPAPNGGKCDHCGGDCIDRCMMCGAPQCCPACCIESREDERGAS